MCLSSRWKCVSLPCRKVYFQWNDRKSPFNLFKSILIQECSLITFILNNSDYYNNYKNLLFLFLADSSDSRLEKDSVHKIMVEYFCTTCCNRCMKRCSRCKISYYCSSDCQQTEWPYHRQFCKLSIYSCANCNKDGCSTKCYKCKSSFYCTRVCHTRHWPKHEQICNFLATCK